MVLTGFVSAQPHPLSFCKLDSRGRLIETRDLVGQTDNRLTHSLGRGMLGRLRQKALKIVARSSKAFHSLVEHGPLQQLLQRSRVEHQNTVERGQYTLPISALGIDIFKVAQHPREDMARTHRLQHFGMYIERLAINL